MREAIFTFVNQYAVWGILILTFSEMLMLWRMHGQLKRLNRNLAAVTGKIQEYFNVIVENEEKEAAVQASGRARRQEEYFSGREERREDGLRGGEERRGERFPVDEEEFNAVMQEFFLDKGILLWYNRFSKKLNRHMIFRIRRESNEKSDL